MTYQDWVRKQHEEGQHGLGWQPRGDDVWEAATKAERERCAKLCENLPVDDPEGLWFNDDMTMAARECAAAIRAT